MLPGDIYRLSYILQYNYISYLCNTIISIYLHIISWPRSGGDLQRRGDRDGEHGRQLGGHRGPRGPQLRRGALRGEQTGTQQLLTLVLAGYQLFQRSREGTELLTVPLLWSS